MVACGRKKLKFNLDESASAAAASCAKRRCGAALRDADTSALRSASVLDNISCLVYVDGLDLGDRVMVFDLEGNILGSTFVCAKSGFGDMDESVVVWRCSLIKKNSCNAIGCNIVNAFILTNLYIFPWNAVQSD